MIIKIPLSIFQVNSTLTKVTMVTFTPNPAGSTTVALHNYPQRPGSCLEGWRPLVCLHQTNHKHPDVDVASLTTAVGFPGAATLTWRVLQGVETPSPPLPTTSTTPLEQGAEEQMRGTLVQDLATRQCMAL